MSPYRQTQLQACGKRKVAFKSNWKQQESCTGGSETAKCSQAHTAVKFGAKGPFFKKNHEKSVLSSPENSGEETALLCGGNDILVRALIQEDIGRFTFLRRYKLIDSWANAINN